MNNSLRTFLRLGNRTLKTVLPERTHTALIRRLKRKPKSPYVSAETVTSSFKLAPTEPAAPPVQPDFNPDEPASYPLLPLFERRNRLAAPQSPIVEPGGALIKPSSDIFFRLRDRTVRCRLVVCCAFSGRHRMLEKIVDEVRYGSEGHGVYWMLVGSTVEDYEFIRALAAKTDRVAGFIVENRPLGCKWQTCVYAAQQYYQAYLYGITGSDDFLSHKLINFIIRRHLENLAKTKNKSFLPSMYGTLEWLVCVVDKRNQLVPQMIKCSYSAESAFEPLGAGRFYTRTFLDACGGLIFESDKDRLLDDRGFFEVRDRGGLFEYYTVEDGPLISVKGYWEQLNTVDHLLQAKTLRIEEFSFAGHAMLRDALSAGSLQYIFKPAVIAPQLNFSGISEQVM